MNISTHEESKGKKRIPQRGPHFTLQWHVTAKCEQDCMHCYLYERPTYESELKNELGFEETRCDLKGEYNYAKTNG